MHIIHFLRQPSILWISSSYSIGLWSMVWNQARQVNALPSWLRLLERIFISVRGDNSEDVGCCGRRGHLCGRGSPLHPAVQGGPPSVHPATNILNTIGTRCIIETKDFMYTIL